MDSGAAETDACGGCGALGCPFGARDWPFIVIQVWLNILVAEQLGTATLGGDVRISGWKKLVGRESPLGGEGDTDRKPGMSLVLLPFASPSSNAGALDANLRLDEDDIFRSCDNVSGCPRTKAG